MIKAKAISLYTTLLLLTVAGCSNSSDHEITASGTIEATEVTVSARTSGELVRLYVDEGSSVTARETLAVVDTTDYALQVRQARANYEATQAQYVQSEAGFENAKDDLRRMEELWTTKSITQKQLDDARTRFTVAQHTISGNLARRDQARAQLDAANKKLADCTITSPLAGTVTKRFMERGELVGQGASLFRVANLTEMDVMIYVSEAELPRVQLGQQAKIRVDAFSERDFEGTVVFISPTAEFTPKNIQTRDERTKLVFGVKVKIRNPDGTLKAGIPADVTLPVGGP